MAVGAGAAVDRIASETPAASVALINALNNSPDTGRALESAGNIVAGSSAMESNRALGQVVSVAQGRISGSGIGSADMGGYNPLASLSQGGSDANACDVQEGPTGELARATAHEVNTDDRPQVVGPRLGSLWRDRHRFQWLGIRFEYVWCDGGRGIPIGQWLGNGRGVSWVY